MRPGRKNTYSYIFPNPNLDSLKGLANQITLDELTKFKQDCGRILYFLKTPFTKYEQEGVHTLLQFYNPSLRCFTFPDYHLVPTLEEYSLFLGISIKEQIPYHSTMKAPTSIEIAKALYLSKSVVEANLKEKGNCQGFHLELLVQTAYDAIVAKEWDTYRAILALSIYGIAMFPNVVNFFDINVIHIFILKIPVLTLLGDVYHSIHHRNGRKGGLVLCCAPLLYRWFRSHLPERGPFVDNRHTSRWADRIMGLVAKDIVWYNRSLDDVEIIMGCGKFDNVPLMGLRGGINYNPVLARRTFGYAFVSPPEKKEVDDLIFYHLTTNSGKLEEVVQAWKIVRRKGKKHFGQKDCATYEAYTAWVKSVAEAQGMPFPLKDPLYPPSEDQPNIVSMPCYNQTVNQNRELTDQMETMQVKMNIARQEKLSAIHKLKQKEKELEELYAGGNTSQKRS
ncbi:uncharacterized protein LOC131597096 [Vicia villosa]|uniref:uncharacterized protein LOC131597096 n=1 Tax=Vicia villosa TaxID=3911 RepID=UPI00273BDFE7|nr:uncharacterized protein LOC131597096 [Vicia villosa]